MKYIIIGASAAGIAAAKKIRQRDSDGTITVLSCDDRIYSRVRLHQFVSGEKDAAGIGFVPQDFFSANAITWEKGVCVSGIDTDKKRVLLADGGSFDYDKLLIASGADAFIPPVPHFREAGNVFKLRTIFDAEKIIAAAASGKKCVIVGSGLVGLDAATALVKRGVAVTLVEMAQRISPLQLDDKAASAYQKLFEAHGCQFLFSAKASDTETDAQGNITALLFEDGRRLECDFLVVAAGVRSSVDFLQGSAVQVEKGVVVDSYMCTTVEDIYAAGDAAGIIGFWMGAAKQGEIAGENMTGGQIAYEKEEPRNALNYYGLSTMSIGGALPAEGEVTLFEDEKSYRRVTTQAGKTVHVLLQGDVSKAMAWQKVVQEKAAPLE